MARCSICVYIYARGNFFSHSVNCAKLFTIFPIVSVQVRLCTITPFLCKTIILDENQTITVNFYFSTLSEPFIVHDVRIRSVLSLIDDVRTAFCLFGYHSTPVPLVRRPLPRRFRMDELRDS